uniref:ER membrane protein complex subunit 4 n=1 Tax=Macaca fascicularis TaxID=9541 RepID=A0A2K5WM19_MACFA
MTETLPGARHKGRTSLAGTQLSLTLNWLQLLPQLSSVFFRTSVLRDVDRFNKDEEKKRKVVSLATEVWGRSDRGSGQGDSLYPVGYLDKQVPDTSVQETDRILVEKRCWDIALGPLKQIPMNLFIMYMAGNTISIFPTMMVCMMAWRPIQALMAISATFKMLESSSQKFLQGLVYLIGNLMGLALAVYKCQSMGLLPTHASDWLAFIEPPERMEFSGGGLLL